MQLHDYDILSGEAVNPPQIIWDLRDRYAIIAFLLLSVDKKIEAEGLQKLEAFMGITQTVNESSGSEEEDPLAELLAMKDAVVREGGAFLDALEKDESYCDGIIDEIDRIIEGNDKCGIGDGYSQWGMSSNRKELPGAPFWLFDYLKLALIDGSYSGNQKRLLKHLARKWDIDSSVFQSIEGYVKSLNEIDRKRAEIENSDIPHREAVSKLAEINAEKKAVWKGLHKLNIAEDRSVSAHVTYTNAIADGIEALGGEGHRIRIREEDEPMDNDDDYEEESLSDKIGDSIVEGIYTVGDLLCKPFEWLTDKIMERT